jgi:hypothetical protein
VTIKGIIKSDNHTIEINSRELLIVTRDRGEFWIGRGKPGVYPLGIDPGITEDDRSRTNARYFGGFFLITERRKVAAPPPATATVPQAT